MVNSINELERSYGNFPVEHQYATLESLELTPDNPELEVFFAAAEKLVTCWQGDKFAGMYLYGEPGTGKTHAAIGLARALHDKGASIHYRHVPSWKPVERNKADFNSNQGQSYGAIPPHITDWIGTRSVHDSIYTRVPPFITSIYDAGHKPTHEKAVLVLDDYRPHARDYVATAIEAASEYGGLVLITSNYTDPFKIVEETAAERAHEVMYEALGEISPSLEELASVMKNELAAKRDALRSRVAAGFKFVYFQGRDRRAETSFWHD